MGVWGEGRIREISGSTVITGGLTFGAGSLTDPEGMGVRVQPGAGGGRKF